MKIGKVRIILNNFLLSTNISRSSNTLSWALSTLYWLVSVDPSPTKAYTNLINNLTSFTENLALLNSNKSFSLDQELQLMRFLFNPEIKTLHSREKNLLRELEVNLKEIIPYFELYRGLQKIILNDIYIKLAKNNELIFKHLFIALEILRVNNASQLYKLIKLKIIDVRAYLKGEREDNTLLFNLILANDFNLSSLFETLIKLAEENIIGQDITLLACDAFTSDIVSLEELATIFRRLQLSDLITIETVKAIRKNGFELITPTENAFHLLLQASIFTPEYIPLLAHKMPVLSAQILIQLNKLGLLSVENGTKALDYPNANIMIMALDKFIEAIIPISIDELLKLLHINMNYPQKKDRNRNIAEKVSAYIYLNLQQLTCPIDEFNHSFIMSRLPTILSILTKFNIKIDNDLFTRIKNLNPNLQDILISLIDLKSLNYRAFVAVLGSIDNIAQESPTIQQVSSCSTFTKAPEPGVVESNAKVNIRETSILFEPYYNSTL